ncbi:hypothetical protein NB459_02070 [Clostridioides difficile]|uniref:hypothetical protein n=1 Tax=Clostridioides difficile TaxID=1496 RepID=UPI00202EB845|nr:hypothetical protein [Clostridioides difficile]MCM0744116.1 hypothetical protein [Clostridioides difficile]
MIRPHGAVLPTRMGIVEILTELSKAVCLLPNYVFNIYARVYYFFRVFCQTI